MDMDWALEEAINCAEIKEERIDLLLSHGADLNSCFLNCCRTINFEGVQILIKKGKVDIEAGFVESCRSKSKEISQFLISNGSFNRKLFFETYKEDPK